jgi:hypothetical protein
MRLGYSPHVAWRQLGKEFVILDLKARRVFGINEAGARVWVALDASHASEDTSHECALGATPAEVPAPVQAFIADLAQHGLLEPIEESRPHTGAPAPSLAGLEAPRITWSEPIATAVQQSFPFQFGNPQCHV